MVLAPANQSEPSLLIPLAHRAPVNCVLLGGRNYCGQEQTVSLAADDQRLVTPSARQARHDPAAVRGKKWAYSDMRYLIETVFGQMMDQFGVKRVRAKDIWHLTSQTYRKVLAHMLALILNMEQGNRPLQFEHLLQS